MSELSEFQKEVGEWGNRTFNSKRNFEKRACTYGIYNHFVKEVKELKTVIQQLFDKNKPPHVSIDEEVADCFILLLHLSFWHGFDLLEAARHKMEINRGRTWGEPDKDGVIEHVKGEPEEINPFTTQIGSHICGYCGENVKSCEPHYCSQMMDSIPFKDIPGLKIEKSDDIINEFKKSKETKQPPDMDGDDL